MLDMSQRATQMSEALATKTTNTGALAGRSPLSAAAACIFMAGQLLGEPKGAKDIQGVAGVSDSTIRHAYKLMYNELDQIIDEDMKKRGADVTKLPKPA
jgi:transcription initiation factor TFIIB